MRNKLLIAFCFICILTTYVEAREGLFVKMSVGPGLMLENSRINGSGFTIVTKNHAIGWGFNKKYALFIGEFGGLINKKVGEYNFINLDAFGVGLSYNTPLNVRVSVMGAYSMVSLAHNWWEATGINDGNGFGINFSVEKEWIIAKRWGVGIGPQVFYLKTMETDYQFINFSINFMGTFYLTPVH
jgi:hypothetical protein